MPRPSISRGAGAARVFEGDGEVLEHRHRPKWLRDLERARDSEARALVRLPAVEHRALEDDLAAVVRESPRDAVDERRLARAVRADQSESPARPDPEAHRVEGDESPETLGDRAHVEQGARWSHGRAPRHFRTSPTMPSGAAITKNTSSTPTMSRLSSDEMFTVAHCCTEPSSRAPMRGPTQVVAPPIIGIAMELTA